MKFFYQYFSIYSVVILFFARRSFAGTVPNLNKIKVENENNDKKPCNIADLQLYIDRLQPSTLHYQLSTYQLLTLLLTTDGKSGKSEDSEKTD